MRECEYTLMRASCNSSIGWRGRTRLTTSEVNLITHPGLQPPAKAWFGVHSSRTVATSQMAENNQLWPWAATVAETLSPPNPHFIRNKMNLKRLETCWKTTFGHGNAL